MGRFGLTGLGTGLLWAQGHGAAEAALSPLPPPARALALCLLEQFVLYPVLYSGYVIPLSALLNGGRTSGLPGEIRARLGPLCLANAKVFIPANLLLYATPEEMVSESEASARRARDERRAHPPPCVATVPHSAYLHTCS